MILKQIPEDFIVKEILDEEATGEGDYLWFTLKKRDWELNKLLSILKKKLGVSKKRLSYAGTKDKKAVTEQTISIWKVDKEDLKKINIKDVEFSNFRKKSKHIKSGDLKGNWFKITVRNLDNIDENKIEKIKKGFLNLFDEQRFGLRNVTHIVGKYIVEREFKQAVFEYLTKKGDKIDDLREELKKTEDYKKALDKFPKSYKWERVLLSHLITYPNDFIGALRKLPRKLLLMFVHAYQSYLWNKTALKIPEKNNIIVPLFGYETDISKYPEIKNIILDILKEENISLQDFKIKPIPELNSKGSERNLIEYPKKLEWNIDKDEINGGKKLIIEFELNKGTYATQLIKSIVNVKL